jgi:hypothetical protein
LLLRAILPLDENLRAGRVKEGLEELPSADDDLRKALDLVTDRGKQIFMSLAQAGIHRLVRADAEPQRRTGRKHSKAPR